MSNNTTSNDWLNFMWTLHNKVRNGKGIKLTGLAALNEINNFLLIFFISKKFKDYGIDEKYSFFTMYENFCNPTLKDNNKDNIVDHLIIIVYFEYYLIIILLKNI